MKTPNNFTHSKRSLLSSCIGNWQSSLVPYMSRCHSWPDAFRCNEANSIATVIWRLHPQSPVKLPIFRPRNYIRCTTEAYFVLMYVCVTASAALVTPAAAAAAAAAGAAITASVTVDLWATTAHRNTVSNICFFLHCSVPCLFLSCIIGLLQVGYFKGFWNCRSSSSKPNVKKAKNRKTLRMRFSFIWP